MAFSEHNSFKGVAVSDSDSFRAWLLMNVSFKGVTVSDSFKEWLFVNVTVSRA